MNLRDFRGGDDMGVEEMMAKTQYLTFKAEEEILAPISKVGELPEHTKVLRNPEFACGENNL